MNDLNEFTGVSDKTLVKRHARLIASLGRMLDSDEELGGGSPFESIYECIDDVEQEMVRRRLMPARQSDN